MRGARLAVCVAGLVAVPAAGQDAPAATLEPYVFEAFDGDTVHGELGRFRVPLNRVRGRADSLTLAFVRFPATTEEPGPPLVYLAGGPGGSGVAAARGSRFPLFMALREYGDVIAFDQRGTGMSDGPSPSECPVERSYPHSQPFELDALRRLTLAVARECGGWWRKAGVDLAAYNTRESADDVAALATALGEEQVRLWAISYGTHLALATIRRHPQVVERAILAGVEGPDHTVKLPSYWSTQLDRLQALIDADPDVRARFPDVQALIGGVLERLDRDPPRIEVIRHVDRDTTRTTVSRFEVETATIDLLRDPGSMIRVPYLYERMATGDFSVVGGGHGDVGGFEAMPEATDAASGMSAARRARFQHEDSTTLLGGGDALIDADMSGALGIPDLGDAFRGPVRSEMPALFISGTLDGRTPVANADEVLGGFPNGRHLIIENAGHSDDLFLSSPGILAEMRRFLAGREPASLALTVPPPALADGRVPPSLPAAFTESMAGAYERSPGNVWRVFPVEVVRSLDPAGRETGRTTSLFLRLQGNGFPLAPRHDTTFYIPGFGPDLVFRFVRGADGAVKRLEFGGPGRETVALRPVQWRAVGFLEAPRWRVAGPYQLAPSESCHRAFPPETDPAELEGPPARGDDGMVDFEESFGASPAGGVGYAALTVDAASARRAQLRLGSDDDARVFLNGERVHAYDGARTAWEAVDTVGVDLRRGENRILVKVCNRDSDWGFTLRITDADGRSLWTETETGAVRVRD